MQLKIMLAVVALAVAIGTGCAVTGQVTESGSLDKVSYVDGKIYEVIYGADYEAGSVQERRELVQTVLSQLEEENYIYQLSYQEEQALFSFQYADGTLGGIALRDFSQGDGLPVNSPPPIEAGVVDH